MKEETPNAEKSTEGTTVVPTPEPEAEVHANDANISNGSAVGPTPSTSNGTSPAGQAKGKAKARKDASVAPSVAPSTTGSVKDKEKDKKQENLVGKINNFISTDVGNITDARDLLFVIWYCPLQIIICIWFLYAILGVA